MTLTVARPRVDRVLGTFTGFIERVLGRGGLPLRDRDPDVGWPQSEGTKSREVSVNEDREELTGLPRLFLDGDRRRANLVADGVAVRPAVDVDEPRVDLLDECRERSSSVGGRQSDGG